MLDPTSLTAEQTKAVRYFHSPKPEYSVFVLTGGPGTGKTTVIEFMESAFSDVKQLIAAPVGCAASRIKNATGRDAHVISKVEFSTALIERYRGCILILDEASMAPLEDTAMLISALAPIKVVVIGDPKQLTCIGQPSLLSTLLAASRENGGDIPVARLTKNLRQDSSACDALAHNIATIGTPDWNGPKLGPSFAVRIFETTEEAMDAAAAAFTKDHQMLSFTKRVKDGLNERTAGKNVRRVVCTKNFYQKGSGLMLVANGVEGTFRGQSVVYANGFIDKPNKKGAYRTQFDDARCLTIHKAEGSEYEGPGIIVPDWMKNGIDAKIVYTAFSRFKRSTVIYGQRNIVEAMFNAKFADPPVDEDAVELLKRYANKS